jgi:hypothetical protein
MKKIFVALSFLALPALMMFSSCSKEDYNSNSGQQGYNPFGTTPGAASQGSFTAKIDGTGFNAETSTSTISVGILVIMGSRGEVGTTQQSITLSVGGEGTGTFPISSTGHSAVYKPAGASSRDAVWGTSGEIVITERDDNHVKGTFNFVAAGINVTDGAFDVKITKP